LIKYGSCALNEDAIFVDKQPLPSSTNKTSNEEPSRIYSYTLLRGHTTNYRFHEFLKYGKIGKSVKTF
jgi:hypothetical protein